MAKGKNPEDRWQEIHGSWCGFAVRIEPGMKLRDIPEDIRMASVPHEGALVPFRFRSGSFFYILWHKPHPLGEHEAEEIQLFPGDYLTIERDWGIGYLRNYQNQK